MTSAKSFFLVEKREKEKLFFFVVLLLSVFFFEIHSEPMAVWSHDRWRELASLCAGFIFATIWFDMMFDVKFLDCCTFETCSEETFAKRIHVVSAYYGQVTWSAPAPMRILLGFVMVLGIFSGYYSWKRHPVLRIVQPGILSVVALMAAISTFPNCYWIGHSEAIQLSLSCRVLYEHALQCSLVFFYILLHLFSSSPTKFRTN